MSADDRYKDCLICGHPLSVHNFHKATRLTVPCPDCTDGTCDARANRSTP